MFLIVLLTSYVLESWTYLLIKRQHILSGRLTTHRIKEANILKNWRPIIEGVTPSFNTSSLFSPVLHLLLYVRVGGSEKEFYHMLTGRLGIVHMVVLEVECCFFSAFAGERGREGMVVWQLLPSLCISLDSLLPGEKRHHRWLAGCCHRT